VEEWLEGRGGRWMGHITNGRDAGNESGSSLAVVLVGEMGEIM
jgi:hypothetical protein